MIYLVFCYLMQLSTALSSRTGLYILLQSTLFFEGIALLLCAGCSVWLLWKGFAWARILFALLHGLVGLVGLLRLVHSASWFFLIFTVCSIATCALLIGNASVKDFLYNQRYDR